MTQVTQPEPPPIDGFLPLASFAVLFTVSVDALDPSVAFVRGSTDSAGEE